MKSFRKTVFAPALLAIAVLSPLAFGQAPEPQTVTFQEPAMRVPVLLEKLSKLTGQQLSASSEFANEVVIVHVKDVPLEKLLENIAQATSGTWRQSGEERILIASTSARRAERQAFEAEIRKFSEAALKESQELFQKLSTEPLAVPPPPMPGQEEDFRGMMEPETAERRATGVARAKVLYQLPLNAVVQAAMGNRVVLSTQPNPLQSPMSPALQISVAEYLAAVSQLPQRPLPEEMELEGVEMDEEMRRMIMRSMAASERGRLRNPDQADRALIVLSGERGVPSLDNPVRVRVQVRFYDADGAFLGAESLGVLGARSRFEMLEELPEFAQPNEPEKPEEETKPETPKSETIQFSEKTLERNKALGMWSPEMGAPVQPSKELMAQLMDPVEFDPHSYENSEALTGLAKAKAKNLVAGLPDTFVLMAVTFGAESITIDAVESVIERHLEPVGEEAEWLVFKPKFADVFRPFRTNRADLKRIIGASQPNFSTTIEDQIRYASGNPLPVDELVIYTLMLRFVSGMIAEFQGFASGWETLKFLGSLSPATRSAVLSGKSVPFSSINRADLDVIQKYVLEGRLPLSSAAEAEAARSADFLEAMFLFSGPSSVDIHEPTEVLAQGLSPYGDIGSNRVQNTAVMVTDSEGNPLPLIPVQGPDFFGLMLSMSQLEPMPGLDRFNMVKLGTQTTIYINIRLTPDVGSYTSVIENQIPRDAKLIGRGDLPASFLEEAKKTSNIMQKMMGGMRGPREIPTP
jgi:hypothetical protein